MSKTAFITGITGQDGSYLARFLLEKGYGVHGLIRWDAVETTDRISDILNDITLHSGDVTDALRVIDVINTANPNEIYNLAALSHVGESFKTPASSFESIVKGTLNIFEAARINKRAKTIKIYQASSSEMYGNAPAPQNENTPMIPCSPYGTAKLAAYNLARIYRETYNMFICNGILFNHESPQRGADFVTQKIVNGAVRIAKTSDKDAIKLGNLDARRDWGHAKDFVRGMWMMLDQEKPDDYVLATGQDYSVRECVTQIFQCLDVPIKWKGEGLNESAINVETGACVVCVDPQFFRPNELHTLRGDPKKARETLGWTPDFTFETLIRDMVNHACQTL